MGGPLIVDRYVGQEIRQWREVRGWSRSRLAAEIEGQPDVRLVRLAEEEGTIAPEFRQRAARALGMDDASLLRRADDRCVRDLVPHLRRNPHGAGGGGGRREALPSGGYVVTRLGRDGDDVGRWFAERYDADGKPCEVLPL